MTGAERANKEKSWGCRLYERRTGLKFSQAELSSMSGVTQQAISKLELHEVTPRFDTMEALARALGTTATELFPYESRPRAKVAS